VHDVPSRVAPELDAPMPFWGELLTLRCRTYCALCGRLLEIGESVRSRRATTREQWRVACGVCSPIYYPSRENNPVSDSLEYHETE